MKPKKIKDKRCKNCSGFFRPNTSLQKACSVSCAIALVKKESEVKELKAWKVRKKEIKEKLKTRTDYLKELQTVFNEYIRKRDEGKPCICCDKPLTKVYHAGHFFSVGAYPNLRFNEDNCHGQREDCNLHKHGNHAEYGIKLRERIGEERFRSLLKERNSILQLEEFEIIELKKYYRQKLKEL